MAVRSDRKLRLNPSTTPVSHQFRKVVEHVHNPAGKSIGMGMVHICATSLSDQHLICKAHRDLQQGMTSYDPQVINVSLKSMMELHCILHQSRDSGSPLHVMSTS